jgi:hypothetical protein
MPRLSDVRFNLENSAYWLTKDSNLTKWLLHLITKKAGNKREI